MSAPLPISALNAERAARSPIRSIASAQASTCNSLMSTSVPSKSKKTALTDMPKSLRRLYHGDPLHDLVSGKAARFGRWQSLRLERCQKLRLARGQLFTKHFHVDVGLARLRKETLTWLF